MGQIQPADLIRQLFADAVPGRDLIRWQLLIRIAHDCPDQLLHVPARQFTCRIRPDILPAVTGIVFAACAPGILPFGCFGPSLLFFA